MTTDNSEKKMFEKELYKLSVSEIPWFKRMGSAPRRHRDAEKDSSPFLTSCFRMTFIFGLVAGSLFVCASSG